MRYEKGRKDISRQRITAAAGASFRRDGIAASGLAGIMKEAGLTNGAFYPHFRSKEALVRESLSIALDQQADQVRSLLAVGGAASVIDTYLSVDHRDNPSSGCASSALLPEIAREPAETREVYASRMLELVRLVAAEFPPSQNDRDAAAFGVFATLIGALELARAVNGTALSDKILAAGADAAKGLLKRHESGRALTKTEAAS